MSSLNQFTRWFCANAARQLDLQPKLDDFWDEDLGNKISQKLYFEDYLLKQNNYPLLVVIDELNEVFTHPQIAQDFLPLLRSCHEEAKRHPLWKLLRLVVVHSTEIYIPLQKIYQPRPIRLQILPLV